MSAHDASANAVHVICAVAASALAGGSLKWLDGPYAGLSAMVSAVAGGALVLDMPLDVSIPAGVGALVREGCDRTLAMCVERFGNAINFQGEPFLPGNDLLARYGQGQ